MPTSLLPADEREKFRYSGTISIGMQKGSTRYQDWEKGMVSQRCWTGLGGAHRACAPNGPARVHWGRFFVPQSEFTDLGCLCVEFERNAGLGEG